MNYIVSKNRQRSEVRLPGFQVQLSPQRAAQPRARYLTNFASVCSTCKKGIEIEIESSDCLNITRGDTHDACSTASSIYSMLYTCKPLAGLLGPDEQQLWKTSQMSGAREIGQMSRRPGPGGRGLYTGC